MHVSDVVIRHRQTFFSSVVRADITAKLSLEYLLKCKTFTKKSMAYMLNMKIGRCVTYTNISLNASHFYCEIF